MLSIDTLISKKYKQTNSSSFRKIILLFLRIILKEKQLKHLQKKYGSYSGHSFCEAIIRHFNIKVNYSHFELENIPVEGGCLVIANHPLGALDALALIHVIHQVRSDIKIVVSDILTQVDQLSSLIIPIDYDTGIISKESLKQLTEHGKKGLIICFPGQEVARRETIEQTWSVNFLKVLKLIQKPVLPIFIDARHSLIFRVSSLISKHISKLLLPREMWWCKNKSIAFKIGELIPYQSIFMNQTNDDFVAKKLKDHLSQIRKGGIGHYKTEAGIMLPEPKNRIKSELLKHTFLENRGNFELYLCNLDYNSPILREIARLRELSFRASGLGSGKSSDFDEYDSYYKHLVLWDDSELELVGAYRYCYCKSIIAERGIQGLYTSKFYTFNQDFTNILPNSIEFGRSFIQPRYWYSRALDYVWYGIAHYVFKKDREQYFFGQVSLSSSLSRAATSLIVEYYSKYSQLQGPIKPDVVHINPFVVSKELTKQFKDIFEEPNPIKRMTNFRFALKMMSCRIPILFKQYSDVVDEGGISFLGFGYDTEFSNCIDGLVLLNCNYFKQNKLERYKLSDGKQSNTNKA